MSVLLYLYLYPCSTAAALLPSFVTVLYEPPTQAQIPSVAGAGLHTGENVAGWTRSQLSNIMSDQYGTAPFIGILDSDSVVKAHGARHFSLFNETTGNPRIFCTQHRDMGMRLFRDIEPLYNPLAPFSCMESFPFMFRRADLPLVQAWLQRATNTTDFISSWSALLARPGYDALAIGNFAMLGAWAFTFARERYDFVIGGNGPLSTCPQLRVGHHVGYALGDWSNHPKLRKPYFQEAARVVAEGRCRAECSSSSSLACADFLEGQPAHHEELLSLEGANENMFGGGFGRAIAKPGCEEPLGRAFAHYEAILTKYCEQWKIV